MGCALPSIDRLVEERRLSSPPSFRPVTTCLGAIVEGVDLARGVDGEKMAVLRDGLALYRVLFFRDQGLDDVAHLALAEALGEPLIHPFERAMGRTNPIHGIVDKPDRAPAKPGWHTDDSYLERPPAYGILRCEVAPSSGGDTMWANMAAAWSLLSKPMQRFLDGLVGVHETDGALLAYVEDHLPPERVATALAEGGTGAAHPIVRTMPETGTRAIYFEPNFVSRIEGLGPAESRFVLAFLERLPEQVGLQVRFRWRPGDVAIWDERTTQHTGTADHAGQLRVMRRCTVVGERPR